MRKLFLITSTLFLAVLLLGSCGKKPVVCSDYYVTKQVTETLPQFNSIETHGNIDVVFTTGEQALSLYGADNVIDYVDLAVENGTLVVRYQEGVVVVGDDNTTVHIAAPQLEAVTVNGSGDASLTGMAQNATFTTNGSGDIDAEDMRVDNLTVKVNGSGDIDCYANNTLVVERNGRGEVSYQGPPTLVVQGNVRGVERDN